MKNFSFFILALSAFNLFASDKVQEEIEVFYKCYGQVVRHRLNPSHPLVKKIRLKKILGSEACMKIINSADLGVDGFLKNKEKKRKNQGRSLKHFRPFIATGSLGTILTALLKGTPMQIFSTKMKWVIT